MSLKTYEIRIGDDWEKVKGTTSGVKPGWLHWTDGEGCTGLSKPGSWREATRTVRGAKSEVS